jgi:hypothetical protein
VPAVEDAPELPRLTSAMVVVLAVWLVSLAVVASSVFGVDHLRIDPTRAGQQGGGWPNSFPAGWLLHNLSGWRGARGPVCGDVCPLPPSASLLRPILSTLSPRQIGL